MIFEIRKYPFCFPATAQRTVYYRQKIAQIFVHFVN